MIEVDLDAVAVAVAVEGRGVDAGLSKHLLTRFREQAQQRTRPLRRGRVFFMRASVWGAVSRDSSAIGFFHLFDVLPKSLVFVADILQTEHVFDPFHKLQLIDRF